MITFFLLHENIKYAFCRYTYTTLNKTMLIQILTTQLVVAATPTVPVKQRHTKTKEYKFYK